MGFTQNKMFAICDVKIMLSRRYHRVSPRTLKGFSETPLGNSKRKARGEKPPRANLSPITLHTANLAYRHVVRIRHRIPQTDAFAFVLVNASVGETRVLIALEVQHRHIHLFNIENLQSE